MTGSGVADMRNNMFCYEVNVPDNKTKKLSCAKFPSCLAEENGEGSQVSPPQELAVVCLLCGEQGFYMLLKVQFRSIVKRIFATYTADMRTGSFSVLMRISHYFP